VLCLGEALVDLVAERQDSGLPEVPRFSAHLGGVTANVAVFAARLGAPVALAGGAGDDAWGRWLLARLEREGVDGSLFTLRPGAETLLAFVTVDEDGEASYALRGNAAGTVVDALADGVEHAVQDSAAVFISTNTLAGREEQAVTMRAREAALRLGRPVIFDANLRLHRWSSPADAAASANACVRGALLVRLNLFEAELMTGESDPERAALALVEGGARLVVLTLGADGVLLCGALQARVPGHTPDKVLSTVGAGDALTGTLLARLALGGFCEPALAAALPEAVEAAAAACQRWGALD
jgi:fructokinase